MLENYKSQCLDPNDWDGTAPPDPCWSPAFQLKDHAWLSLKRIYDLPEESRRDFDVLVSVLRSFMDEKRRYLPPSGARDQFSDFAKKAEELKELFVQISMNETSSEYIDADAEFWGELMPAVRSAAQRMRGYSADVSSKTVPRGQKWAYHYHFAEISEHILNRYGFSLADGHGRKKPCQGSITFLRELFTLATCGIQATRAANIIKRIADRKKKQSQAGADQ